MCGLSGDPRSRLAVPASPFELIHENLQNASEARTLLNIPKPISNDLSAIRPRA